MIGQYWSRDLNTGLSLVEIWGKLGDLIGQYWSRDLNTGLSLVHVWGKLGAPRIISADMTSFFENIFFFIPVYLKRLRLTDTDKEGLKFESELLRQAIYL